MTWNKKLFYSNDHIWVDKQKDIAVLGMIPESYDKAQDIVFVNLPKVGEKLEINDVLLGIESVKWSGEISSPVKGKVLEVNSEVFDNPEKLKSDWAVKVKVEEYGALMNSEEAKNFYEEKK